MAIQTGGFLKRALEKESRAKLAADYKAQAARAKKRSKWSKMLGGIGGKLLGTAATGLFGLTGFGVPIAMALSSMAAKKGAHEATRGMAADASKLKSDKYGFAAGDLATYKEGLKAQMATDPFKQHGALGQELATAFISSAMAGDLKGATKQIGSGKDIGKAFIDPKATKGLEGMKESLMDLVPGYKKFTGKTMEPEKLSEAAQEHLQEVTSGIGDYGSGKLELPMAADSSAFNIPPMATSPVIQEEWIPEFGQATLNTPDSNLITSSPQDSIFSGEDFPSLISDEYFEKSKKKSSGWGQSQSKEFRDKFEFQYGGQVPKYYGGGMTGEENAPPTIANYFEMQGMSLGGSNKKSLSQMLGQK
jgi:hypothetical protein